MPLLFVSLPTLKFRRKRIFPLCPRASGLDDVPESVKLNAVAEALARRRDVRGAIDIVRTMSSTSVPVERSAVSAVVDAVAASGGSPNSVATSLNDVLTAAELPGYGSAAAMPLSLGKPLPDPWRGIEVASAAAFLFVVGGSALAEFVEPTVFHHTANDATALLLFVATALIYDRYASKARGWKCISGGLSRLFSEDPARASRVEAAHFLTAYLLGLPWFCFQPDTKKLLELQSEQRAGSSSQKYMLSLQETDVDRYLIWIMAGVAAESQIDGSLIESDVTPAYRLLRALRDKKSAPSEMAKDKERVQAAFATAEKILESHRVMHEDLAKLMLNGTSAGDCAVYLAREFAAKD